MATHFNSSNITYTSRNGEMETHLRLLFRVYKGNQVFVSVVGSVLNLWFLAAIVSSSEVRSRLRNKIICNSFVLHLLNCAIILPITVHIYYLGTIQNCIFYTVVDNLNLIHELVSNWLLVILVIVFIAQIVGFNPRTRLSFKSAIIGTVALLAFPWVVSVVTVPVIVHEYAKHRVDKYQPCIISDVDSLEVLRSIDTALPIILAVLLVIVAAVLRRQRYALGNTRGSIQAELFEPGPEIDKTCPYVVAVVVSTICDLPRLVLALSGYSFGNSQFWPLVHTIFAAGILGEARAILMPITWLLLPDIRQRIKSWRPWPSARTDLTVTFQKEND